MIICPLCLIQISDREYHSKICMAKEYKTIIEIRKDCKECGKDIVDARYRTFCSAECRVRFNNKKRAGYGLAWQRAKRASIASQPSKDKCQCLICGKWYVQVCSHTAQVHKMNGRQYREYFELEVKRGVVPEWYRKLKGDQAIDNETYKNLEAGAGFRFKKGQIGCGVYKRSPITMERLKRQGKNMGTHN